MLEHTPVLADALLSLLTPQPGEYVLDCTVGLGGHASKLLEAISPDGALIGLDADEQNLFRAREHLARFQDRVILMHANFASLPRCLPQGALAFDIVIVDLGLSSPHVDDPTRGFRFKTDSPLDMRYDQSSGMTAAEFLEKASEREIAEVLRVWGELPKAKALAAAIVERRRTQAIRTSLELQDVIERVFGFKTPSILPQVFQALRIRVNDELASLTHLLETAPQLLNPSGRLAAISYHSLEDRLVKRHFRTLSSPLKDPVTGSVRQKASFQLLTNRPIDPTEQEKRVNPRSRSAHLRAIQRV